MKLFFFRTISVMVAAIMINFIIAGTLYAQNYYAANTKITPHKPVIQIKDEKKVSDDEEGFFSKYKWWLLAGAVVIGGAAAAGGGGGVAEGAPRHQPMAGRLPSDGRKYSVNQQSSMR